MTSISSSISMGRQMMDARISKAVSGGSISITDQTALESALNSIDSTLSLSGTNMSTSGTDMKTKMNMLIQNQVSAGTLTSGQASELQSLFAQGPGGSPPPQTGNQSTDQSDDPTAIASTGRASTTGGVRHAHGHSHMHGTPPASDEDTDTSDDESDTSSMSLADTTSPSETAEQKKLGTLISFLDNLRSSVSSTTYGGATGDSSTNSGLLVNASA